MTFQEKSEIVKIVATLVLGLAASVVAYQQFKLARNKLKLDLFEKMFALYNSIYESFLAVVRESNNTVEYLENIRIYRQSIFLFDLKTYTYVLGLRNRLMELSDDMIDRNKVLSGEIPSMRQEEKTELLSRISDSKKKLRIEIESLPDVFQKYLRIRAT